MKFCLGPEQQLRATTSFIAGSPGSRKVEPLGQSGHSPSCLLTGKQAGVDSSQVHLDFTRFVPAIQTWGSHKSAFALLCNQLFTVL